MTHPLTKKSYQMKRFGFGFLPEAAPPPTHKHYCTYTETMQSDASEENYPHETKCESMHIRQSMTKNISIKDKENKDKNTCLKQVPLVQLKTYIMF